MQEGFPEEDRWVSCDGGHHGFFMYQCFSKVLQVRGCLIPVVCSNICRAAVAEPVFVSVVSQPCGWRSLVALADTLLIYASLQKVIL